MKDLSKSTMGPVARLLSAAWCICSDSVGKKLKASEKPIRVCIRQSKKCDKWQITEDFGGAERDRTADLLIANEALSQLSYGPN